jgi:hypothetical protein
MVEAGVEVWTRPTSRSSTSRASSSATGCGSAAAPLSAVAIARSLVENTAGGERGRRGEHVRVRAAANGVVDTARRPLPWSIDNRSHSRWAAASVAVPDPELVDSDVNHKRVNDAKTEARVCLPRINRVHRFVREIELGGYATGVRAH